MLSAFFRKLWDVKPRKPVCIDPWAASGFLLFAVFALWLVVAEAVPAQTSRVRELPKLFTVPAADGWEFQAEGVIALEEHRFFTYVVARGAPSTPSGQETGDKAPRLVRRFISLDSALHVIDDVVRGADEDVRFVFHSDARAQVDGNRFRINMGDEHIACQVLVPAAVSYQPVATNSKDRTGTVDYQLAVGSENSQPVVRTIHLFAKGVAGEPISWPATEVVNKEGEVQLTVTTPQRVYRLILPPADRAAGEIAVAGSNGERLLVRRLFPSGVLPSGPEGTQLLERWDARYRGEEPPPWDVGRPSSELKKAVEDGVLSPCRAVVLGCGTGTNAIYLAGKGFEVTGIDIAPTALNLCRKKAEEAGVHVQWLLADVLAPPDLEPFDLIYDRGCYHGVRRQNAAGYVESVRKLSHPGTRLLILAGNANEARHYGPPRVKEEELRGDFSESFEFEWLRETHFDTKEPSGQGALAWSALLKRKKQ